MNNNISFEQLPQAVSRIYDKLTEIERLILQKGSETPSNEDQLLTIQQASQLLNLSVPTLYGYVQRSKIPVSKRGKRLYFSKNELLEWIKAGRKKTIDELTKEAEIYINTKGGAR